MSERPSMRFNKFQKSFQKWGNLWVERQRSSPYWERKRIGIRRRSNLHPILRHEGNQKSLDKRRRKRCYWFHEIFVFHSWYLSHKIFIYRRQMWKISISHIFLWMFLSFGLQLAHLCSLHTLLGYFTYRSNLLSVLVRSTNCRAMFNFMTAYILWLKITTLLT